MCFFEAGNYPNAMSNNTCCGSTDLLERIYAKKFSFCKAIRTFVAQKSIVCLFFTKSLIFHESSRCRSHRACGWRNA